MEKAKHAAYAIVLLLIAGITLISYLVYLEGQKPGDFDQFAECLSDKGLLMAGTDWCSACKNQKDLFGTSFRLINYKNCDLEKTWCSQNNVEAYPTWVGTTGMRFTGVKSFQQLSQISGCSLETEA